MASSLPASIESYLKEADFSPTEILILHYLLEGAPVTLRELSVKVGKSTGTLDGGMKKLIRRRLVTRENINGIPKYIIPSLEMVLDWVRRYVQKRKDLLKRKEKDFEKFISSLKREENRPGMDYFEGEDGVKKAYEELLRHAIEDGKEMLQYLPADSCDESDPLYIFKIEYFRARRSNGVKLRVIAPDAEATRKYSSRDPFEYRQTVLVPENEFPHELEHIIAGDTMACINRAERRAYFIHAPDLIRAERQLFEYMWARSQEAQKEGQNAQKSKPQPLFQQVISALRGAIDFTRHQRIMGQHVGKNPTRCRVKDARRHH